MATQCKDCPLRRLPCFDAMSADEVSFMQRFKSGEMTVEPGSQVVMEGSSSAHLFTVLRGMGLRYKTLPDGRRQVVNFVLPGDFIGLQSGLMGEMRHSVEATTRMTLCVFNRSEIWSLFRSQPQRAYDLTWLAAVELTFLGDALTSVGQHSALERICWALVRLYRRGEALGLLTDKSMPLPYRQQDLADALGLSLVHTNKTLAKLRERGLAAWQEGCLKVPDVEKLAEMSEVDSAPDQKRPLM